MSSITVTHAPSGLVHASVARTERVTPHMVRVTLTGDDLRRFDHRGFDQWFRLAVPVDDHARFDNLPDTFDTRSYLRYLVLPKSTRPVIRNYTVRAFRRDELELDIDFVCHGTAGIAGPWAESVEPGTEVAFIDQGCGWAPVRRTGRCSSPTSPACPRSSASCGTCRATPSGTRSSSSSTPRTRRTSTPPRG